MRQFDNYAAGGTSQLGTTQQDWTSAFNEALGSDVATLYANAFPPGYCHDFDAETALADIELINQLDDNHDISMRLTDAASADDSEQEGQTQLFSFRLMTSKEAIALSDVLPLLENFGLRVLGERPYEIIDAAGQAVWLHVFALQYNPCDASRGKLDIATVAPAFEEAFRQVWEGNAESDLFNRLIFSIDADWRSIAMLRGYSRYMKQINLHYTRPFVATTLATHSTITDVLAQLFDLRFNPANTESGELMALECELLETAIIEGLENVDNLNEDKIIRQFLTLIKATVRTNFYQRNGSGDLKPYFSFKFEVAAIPEAPKPRPLYEIFVYSPRLEGVHLRGGKVARGGLRWSDRPEDFRTEVLGLVKAQQVKNSVIVPMGAKGGFVCKQAPSSSDREAFQAEGVACYRLFISALLDITDNLVDGEVVPPQSVVRWDNDDPYLVVAADKGTATFSDIANEISIDYGFWLGDAFASGGSVGYDHKKMGITARGAWVSVQRHFRELGLNTQEEDFTVVGVGDMAGDVFGNGMLCSEHICLVAAFNHMHIFIDPNPDAAASYQERKRLFELPRSSWSDYNSELISAGGGIFSRAAKTIPLSAEIKARFAIDADELAPNDLLKAILKAPVDLFWNGGIGTYAKASQETDDQVGDRANDSVRVNAAELGARVIGEGGNLGVTQQARMEYGLNGGRCNTDFIDNAAGVDCSDHEVNIKILLNSLMADGVMGEEDRNRLLESMTDSVADLVLENNYRQTQAISMAEFEASVRAIEYRRLISHYESLGKLDRDLEFIPADDVLAERKAVGKALTRAELSVLVSYGKLTLKESLADSDIAADAYLAKAAYEAFPQVLRDNYAQYIDNHQLHKEIVATQVAGDLVNRMGITFVQRMQQATGESEATIAKAYVAVRDLFKIDARWREIEALDYAVSNELQSEMISQLVRLVRRSTRWLLRARRAQIDPQSEIAYFEAAANYLSNHAGELLHGKQSEGWQQKVARYTEVGVPRELATFVASARYCYTSFAIAEGVDRSSAEIASVAECYFALGEKLQLNWFADQIVQMGVENYWQAMARESFRDDLENQQASLAENLIESAGGSFSEAVIEQWFAQHDAYVARWQEMMAELRCTEELDLAMFPVAIRELLDLSQASQQAINNAA